MRPPEPRKARRGVVARRSRPTPRAGPRAGRPQTKVGAGSDPGGDAPRARPRSVRTCSRSCARHADFLALVLFLFVRPRSRSRAARPRARAVVYVFPRCGRCRCCSGTAAEVAVLTVLGSLALESWLAQEGTESTAVSRRSSSRSGSPARSRRGALDRGRHRGACSASSSSRRTRARSACGRRVHRDRERRPVRGMALRRARTRRDRRGRELARGATSASARPSPTSGRASRASSTTSSATGEGDDGSGRRGAMLVDTDPAGRGTGCSRSRSRAVKRSPRCGAARGAPRGRGARRARPAARPRRPGAARRRRARRRPPCRPRGRGEPAAFPPGDALAAYRIVQEALTNVRKHAGGGRVVVVRYTPGALDLAVENEGVRRRTGGPAAGHGLIGMRERVALYGGELEVGPRPEGGIRVRARLPVEARARDPRPPRRRPGARSRRLSRDPRHTAGHRGGRRGRRRRRRRSASPPSFDPTSC